MAFVIEEIPEDKLEEKHGIVTAKTSPRWVYDHERDASLAYVGGGREYYRYELKYDGVTCVMYMDARKVSNQPRELIKKGIFYPIYECEWMEIAEEFLPRLQEVYQITTEAFETYGNRMKPETTGDVTVIFPEGMRLKDINTRVDIKTK